jgi:ATP-binding cassette subfamily C protein CydCD
MHRKLLTLTRDTRPALLLTVLSGLLAGLLTIGQAWLFSSVINAIFFGKQTLAQVMSPLGLILLTISGRALLAWLTEISASAVAIKIKTDLRNRLFAHILKLGPAYARGQRTGELTAAAIEGVEALDAYFSQYLPQLVITTLVPISILVFVFPIDLLSGFILLVTAPLIPFFMILIGKGAEIVTKRQYETLRLLSAHFLDSLQGLTTLKLFGQSKAQARTIAQVSEKFRDTTLGVLRITFLSALALELLATLSTAIIAVEIGFRLLYGRMDYQPALFLLVLAPEFYLPLRALGARFHAGMSGTTAARRIYEILDMPAQESVPGERTGEISSVELKNVSYTYPGETAPALQNISLEIPQGQHLALVGKTGAGKSTLAQLLLGFIQPTSGEIHPSPRSLRQAIAWIPQRPYLFHDTLAANIRIGKADAMQSEISAAAQAAHLHDFIEALPQKYETVIGEGGARLSSGQAQRLALARAFLKNAPILILDEPTSSLDPETEALLEESTRALMQGRTSITIAHRLNTIFQSDQIIVLDAGRIVEQGTHSQLLHQNGLYAGMVKTYAQNETQKPQLPTPPAHPPAPQPASSGSHSPEIPAARLAVLPRLLSFLQGNWQRVALSVLLGSITIGSSIALMGTSAWLISTAAISTSVADLGVSVVATRLFGITRGVFRYLERLASHDVTFRLLARLRTWFYEKLEPLAPARLMEFRAGDLLARIIGDVETLENFYVRIISPPLTAATIGIFTALFLASFYPPLAPAFLVFFLSLGLLLPILAQRLSAKPAEQTVSLRADLSTQLVDGIQGMADLLAYGHAEARLAQVAASGLDYGHVQRRMTAVTGFQAGLATLLTQLGMWTVLFLSIPQVTSGRLAGPMLAALSLLTLAAFEAVIPLPLAAQLWNASRAAASRLFEVVDTQPAVKDAPAHSLDDNWNSRLEFSKLSFTYPGQSAPAVQDITFTIEQGNSIAIVGPSGAGKSTLANLLLRFWDYQSGQIFFSGESLKALNPDQVRERIALISQNTYFFNTTIYENLRFARRRVTREEVEAAAQAAQIHDFILGLPKGYDTLIGEQGLRLSGGERQRLAIARALIKDAPILILDEPTANLDPLTEARVLETLFALMKNKISLLITHRLVGMENLDEILVMDQGQIMERGAHAELMQKGGLYQRLWVYQNRILEATLSPAGK